LEVLRTRTEKDHQKRVTIGYFPQYLTRYNDVLFQDNHNLLTILLITKTNITFCDFDYLRILRVRI
jgi:hypothetical protein